MGAGGKMYLTATLLSVPLQAAVVRGRPLVKGDPPISAPSLHPGVDTGESMSMIAPHHSS